MEAVLKRLILGGFYRRVDLEEALSTAAKAVIELPNSMVREWQETQGITLGRGFVGGQRLGGFMDLIQESAPAPPRHTPDGGVYAAAAE